MSMNFAFNTRRPAGFPFGIATLALALWAGPALAFNSGSTGADGAFNPTVNTVVQLPPSGVLNYTSVNIPSGVTVSFAKNATNTPVVMLVSGNATIAGGIGVGGGASPAVGAAGSGLIGDDGLPGAGGPGGYSGGVGGQITYIGGGMGLGPGGGNPGVRDTYNTNYVDGGAGAGFGANGSNGGYYGNTPPQGGNTYGSANLLPLVGGSGGGGGGGGTSFSGSGGGGGGGAILLAVSGTLTISGGIWADGGTAGATTGSGCGSGGGGGSGGAIRLIATSIAGNGTLSANYGSGGSSSGCNGYSGGSGAIGRIRLEAETFTRTAASTPTHSFGPPGPVFITGMPSLKIATVAGVAVPDQPTGSGDISLPSTTANPVVVTFITTGVPPGNTVKLTVTPASGSATSATSNALSGDTTSATSSVSITLPQGPSTLIATVTYTVVAAVGDALGTFAGNERVEKVELLAALWGGEQRVKLITVSGREFVVPAAALALAAG